MKTFRDAWCADCGCYIFIYEEEDAPGWMVNGLCMACHDARELYW